MKGRSATMHQRLGTDRLPHQVVTVQRDVPRPGRHVVAGDFLEASRQATRDVDAARAHADERQLVNTLVAFDDFVGDAGQGAADAVRIHYCRHLAVRPN